MCASRRIASLDVPLKLVFNDDNDDDNKDNVDDDDDDDDDDASVAKYVVDDDDDTATPRWSLVDLFTALGDGGT